MIFQIARTSRATGLLLQSLVREEFGDDALERLRGVVCYGVGYSGEQPSLNRNCSRYNKLEQAQLLYRELQAQAIIPLSLEEALEAFDVRVNPVFLARNAVHSQGRDIKVCVERWHIESAARSGSEFFTPYQSSVGEYRVWSYRKRHLGTYRKLHAHPERFTRIGRNQANGFAFERIELSDVPTSLSELGRRAIAACGLDFGATDIIETQPGCYKVLEVNSAPGVADGRRAVIPKLAHRIGRWSENGCPDATP